MGNGRGWRSGNGSERSGVGDQSHTQQPPKQVAPGKVTRTSKLGTKPGPDAAERQERAPAATPAQQGVTSAAAPQVRSLWQHTMDPWMDAAHRGTPAPDPAGGAAVQAKGDTETSEPTRVHRAAARGIAGSGGTLPYLDEIQKSFGPTHDLSGVRAHVGGAAAEASAAMSAEAYATGEDIAFRSQPDLHTAAHEAAHVVQQRAGVHLAGGVGRAGDAYECQADAVAERVVRGESVEHLLAGHHAAGAHAVVQRAPGDETVDGGAPELAVYEGAAVGQPGKISAPAGQYEHARSAGVNVRARPDGALPEIGKVRYNATVHVKSLDVTGAFYFIMSRSSGVIGWINRHFVALDMPDAHAELHHITEPDLTTILKNHYVDGGLWQLGTGNDYTTLAAAVVAANQGREGVQIDWISTERTWMNIASSRRSIPG